MKVKHIPTNIILEIEKARNIKYLFGKIWYDKDYKCFLIGDKKRLDKYSSLCYNKGTKKERN